MSLKALKNANAASAAGQAKFVVNDVRRFHPTGDLVLLEAAHEKYQGLIELPDNVLPTVPIGRIIAKGPSVPDDRTGEFEGFKLGELVGFAVQAAVALDSEHWLIQAKAIACHVDEPRRVQA
jgi:hypothetical protein